MSVYSRHLSIAPKDIYQNLFPAILFTNNCMLTMNMVE